MMREAQKTRQRARESEAELGDAQETIQTLQARYRDLEARCAEEKKALRKELSAVKETLSETNARHAAAMPPEKHFLAGRGDVDPVLGPLQIGLHQIARGQPGILDCERRLHRADLLLQIGVGREQHGTGTCGSQGRRQGVAGLQEGQLAGAGTIQCFGARDLRIPCQVPGAGVLHGADPGEQAAEAHSPGGGRPGS